MYQPVSGTFSTGVHFGRPVVHLVLSIGVACNRCRQFVIVKWAIR